MRTEEIRVSCILVKQNFKRFKKDLNQGKLTKDENIYMQLSATCTHAHIQGAEISTI